MKNGPERRGAEAKGGAKERRAKKVVVGME